MANIRPKKTKNKSRLGNSIYILAGMVLFCLNLILSVHADAAINEKINYQGKLTDSNNIIVPDGAYDMVFRLYTAPSGGSTVWTESWTATALWSETGTTTINRNDSGCGGSGFTSISYSAGANESSLAVGQYIWNMASKESAAITSVDTGTNTICVGNPYSNWANGDDLSNRIYLKGGLFSTMLGSVSDLSGVNFNQTLYLGLTIGSDPEMSPRKVLGAVPASFTAATINNNDSATLGTNAGATLDIGNTTGGINMNSGGASSWTNTSGGLTFATATSGDISLNSAGALNFSAAAASTVTLANIVNALNFDSGTLSIDALNNRVGIGTATPGYDLDVNGALRSNRYILGVGPDMSLLPVVGGQSVLSSWWGLQLIGNRQANVDYTPANYGLADDFSVIIPNQQASKIGLVIRGAAAQAGNLMQWQDSGGVVLGAIDSNGRIGVGTNAPSAYLDLKASDVGSASLQINPGVAPTTPSDGDFWYDGTHLYFRNNLTSRDLLAVSGGVTAWDVIGDPSGDGSVAMGQTSQSLDWVMGGNSDLDGITFSMTNAVGSENKVQNVMTVANLDDSAVTGTVETMVHVDNRDVNETISSGLLVEQTGAGTMTNAINILETAGTVTTAINIGNNVGTGIVIGTGTTTGISVGSGGITIVSGALAVNSDEITSDGNLVINATATDIQDALTADSLTTDIGGVSIAASQSYTGVGAVTLSSGNSGVLTLNSASNTLTIDSSDTALTASGIVTLTLAANASITNASGNLSLQPAGNSTTASVQVGAGGSGSSSPDMLALDVKSTAGDPTGFEGAMYYNNNTNKFRCYQESAWTDCIGSGSSGSLPDTQRFVDTTTESLTDANVDLWDGTYPNATSSSTTDTMLVNVVIRGTSDGNDDETDAFTIRRAIGANPTCTGTIVGGIFTGGFTTSSGVSWTANATFLDAPGTASEVRYTVCSDTASTGTVSNDTGFVEVSIVELGN